MIFWYSTNDIIKTMGFKDGTKVLAGLGMRAKVCKVYDLKCADGRPVQRVAADAPGLINKFYYTFKKNYVKELTAMESIQERCALFVKHVEIRVAQLSKYITLWFTIPGQSHSIKDCEQQHRIAATLKQRALLRYYDGILSDETKIAHVAFEKSRTGDTAAAAVVPTSDPNLAPLLIPTDQQKALVMNAIQAEVMASGIAMPESLAIENKDICIASREELIAKRDQQFCNTRGEDFGEYLNAALRWMIQHENVIFTPDGREDEIYIAYLTSLDKFDAVLSEDFDVLLMNPGIVIRNMLAHGDCEVINTHELYQVIQAKWGINRDQFLDFMILCGNDFAKLPGFGPTNALKYIRTYGSIDAMMARPDKAINRALKKLEGGAQAPLKGFDYAEARAQFGPFDVDEWEPECAEEMFAYYSKKPMFWIDVLRARIGLVPEVELRTFYQNLCIRLQNYALGENGDPKLAMSMPIEWEAEAPQYD